MVLSNRSRCMILTMVGNFDHLLPTLRLICGVLGMKSVANPGYLCCRVEKWFTRGRYSIKSRSYGRWNCSGEREEMDSRLEHLWPFYLRSLFRLSWVEVWFFSLFFLLKFFLRRWPILHNDRAIGREHNLNRPFEMDRLTVEILGFVVRGIVWWRWISILGVSNWHARHFEASKQWVRKGERSVDDKYLPWTDSPFETAQNNSR